MQNGRAFQLGMIQMRVEPGQPSVNLATAERLAITAAQAGAEVLLFPEALDCGWTHASARELAGEIPGGRACQTLRSMARHLGVYVCAGIIERADGQIYNAAVLISPAGDVLLHHRKLNELDFARALYAPGDRLGVARTPLGSLGLMICADAFVPGQAISRTLGHMAADCILSPCSWAVPPSHDPVRDPYGKLWLDNYGPVARDFEMPIAGASNVGPVRGGEWDGWKCIGCSMIVGKAGTETIRAPYGPEAETVLVQTVELRLADSYVKINC